MGEKIYGVDLSKKITPIMVRDAIFKCFLKAHEDVLNSMDEYTEWESKEERERFRQMEVGLIIKNAFNEAKVVYDNPTKEGLIKVLDCLAGFASQFRKPEIVKKHYSGIKKLVDKMD